MLPREHRVRTWFFTKRKKPVFVIQEPAFSIKKYFLNTKQPGVTVVVPKKTSSKAVRRNAIKRKVYNVFEQYIQQLPTGAYVVYVQKDVENIISLLEKAIQTNLLDK